MIYINFLKHMGSLVKPSAIKSQELARWAGIQPLVMCIGLYWGYFWHSKQNAATDSFTKCNIQNPEQESNTHISNFKIQWWRTALSANNFYQPLFDFPWYHAAQIHQLLPSFHRTVLPQLTPRRKSRAAGETNSGDTSPLDTTNGMIIIATI